MNGSPQPEQGVGEGDDLLIRNRLRQDQQRVVLFQSPIILDAVGKLVQGLDQVDLSLPALPAGGQPRDHASEVQAAQSGLDGILPPRLLFDGG